MAGSEFPYRSPNLHRHNKNELECAFRHERS